MPAALSAAAYPSLFRSLPGLYLLLAPDGTILDNSDDHVRSSLLPREQAVGRNIFDAYPAAPESQRALDASHEYVRQHRTAHTMPLTRYDLQRPDGSTEERYWQITHYPILDAAGELQYILQQPHDVTATHLAETRRQEAAQELAETQERTRFTLESLPVMLWTALPDGRIDYFNQRVRDFIGFDANSPRTVEESLNIIHPDDRPRVVVARQQARLTGAEYQIEYRLQRYDGAYRWLLARGVPRLNDSGDIVQWVGCALDIHEQRQLVEELLLSTEQQAVLADQAYEARQAAVSQRALFLDLFMQAPAVITLLRGPHHRFDFVNTHYQAIFPGRQLLGLPLAEALPEVAEQGFAALLDGVYQTGEPYTGTEVPVLIADPTGEMRQRYFNFVYQAFYEDGARAGVGVFGFDVTEVVLARQ